MNSKKTFSRLGIAMFAFLALSNIFSVIFALIFEMASPGTLKNSDTQTLVTFVSVDLIGFAVFWLIVRNMPKFALKRKKVGIVKLFIYFAVCVAVSVFGSVIGTALSAALSGGDAQNYVSDLMENPGPFTIFDVVIFGPIAEEIICRKLVIDRTVQFGEKNAIIFSAVLFGLMHGNFYQAFYAFAIGLVFAYVYTRSGKIRYTVALHMVFNFVCGVLPGLLPSETFFAALDWTFVVLGIAFIAAFRKNIYFRRTLFELRCGEVFKTVYLNAGMFLFFAAVVFELVYALI